MKKILFFLCIIILPPLILNNFCINKQSPKIEKIKNVFIRIKKSSGDIIKVNMEDYIIGVLAGEMPINFELEALKAQAVAARSYAFNRINKDKLYDVVDTTANQVYRSEEYLESVWQDNYYNNIKKITNAVNQTSNEYIFYKNKIIDAFFFSTSSGMTENSIDVFGFEKPYLQSVDSSWDINSPSFISKSIIAKQEFMSKLKVKNFNISNIKKNKSGSINTLTIDNKIITGLEFRKLFNLKSTNFEMERQENNIIIKTKGFGHGVGMSQYGAQHLAKKGYDYKKIIQHYYKNVEILKK